MGFLKGFFSVCHSIHTGCHSSRVKGFERYFEVVNYVIDWSFLRANTITVRPFCKCPGHKVSFMSPIWEIQSPSGEQMSPIWAMKARNGNYSAPFGDYKAHWGIKHALFKKWIWQKISLHVFHYTSENTYHWTSIAFNGSFHTVERFDVGFHRWRSAIIQGNPQTLSGETFQVS